MNGCILSMLSHLSSEISDRAHTKYFYSRPADSRHEPPELFERKALRLLNNFLLCRRVLLMTNQPIVNGKHNRLATH